MKSILLGGITLLWGLTALSQTFTKDQVKEDLLQLADKIREFNPGLRAYNPFFDQKVDSIIGSLDSEYNKYESYALISQICALSNEGHFEIGQWTDNVKNEILNDSKPFLPFSVIIVDRKLYVNGDYTDDAVLQVGDQINSINGMSDDDIINKLQLVTPSDGDIETYQYKKIEDNFPWYYYFYIEQPERFDLELTRDDEEKKLEISALTKTERQNNFKKRNESKITEESMDDVFELKLEDGYAYLHLKSFDWRLVEKYDLKADDFYADIFEKINAHGSSSLIVDLRGNTGGRKAFGEGIVPFVRVENEVPFLIKNTSWKGKVKTVKKAKSTKNPYDGTIYVLVDGYTYSVGGIIARYLQELNGAVTIGEETGTRYEGFVAGSAQYTTLPHSAIRIGVPCYLKEFPVSSLQTTANRGLIPQYEVQVSLEDRLEKRDPVLEKALELIKKNTP